MATAQGRCYGAIAIGSVSEDCAAPTSSSRKEYPSDDRRQQRQRPPRSRPPTTKGGGTKAAARPRRSPPALRPSSYGGGGGGRRSRSPSPSPLDPARRPSPRTLRRSPSPSPSTTNSPRTARRSPSPSPLNVGGAERAEESGGATPLSRRVSFSTHASVATYDSALEGKEKDDESDDEDNGSSNSISDGGKDECRVQYEFRGIVGSEYTGEVISVPIKKSSPCLIMDDAALRPPDLKQLAKFVALIALPFLLLQGFSMLLRLFHEEADNSVAASSNDAGTVLDDVDDENGMDKSPHGFLLRGSDDSMIGAVATSTSP